MALLAVIRCSLHSGKNGLAGITWGLRQIPLMVPYLVMYGRCERIGHNIYPDNPIGSEIKGYW